MFHFLNKTFKFGNAESPLSSFRKLKKETTMNFFGSCTHTQCIWNKVQASCLDSLAMPNIISHSAIVDLLNVNNEHDTISIIYCLSLKSIYIKRESVSTSFNLLKNKLQG